MIVSASRRTDIPAFYSDWLRNRLLAGYALVRNPYRPDQLRRVDLRPEAVDGLVLWSKCPHPLLEKPETLEALSPYPYYLQFTLTPYGPDVEPGLPDKQKVLIPCFQRLSEMLGANRVLWRYDPILVSPRHTAAFHLAAFARFADALAGYTRQCTISFLDLYRHIDAPMRGLGVVDPSEAEKRNLSEALAKIADARGMSLCACAEPLDLSAQGVSPARCVDASLLSQISGKPFKFRKDPAQREGCGCAQSVDIGIYHSCPNGCLYCYANHGENAIKKRIALYDALSSI
ncbi:MAG TPA: DUF1848 domain-containing protein, partial [Clostridia bacterium]|nr:DUF1848 domain-containing protein [Clostridia bacterium]